MASMFQSIQHSPWDLTFKQEFSSHLGKKWNSQLLKELNIW